MHITASSLSIIASYNEGFYQRPIG